jgi:hypothetical protein
MIVETVKDSPSRLHQFVPVELQRLDVRRAWYNENSGGYRDRAGRRAHDETEPGFCFSRYLEINFDETECRIKRQRDPKPYSRASCIVVRQQHGTDERAHTDSHEHGPQAPHKLPKTTPDQGLPDVRDQ